MRFKVRSESPIPLHPMLLSKSTVPHAQKLGILGVSMLLTKKSVYHYMVNTDDPIVFVILQQFNDFLCFHIFMTR